MTTMKIKITPEMRTQLMHAETIEIDVTDAHGSQRNELTEQRDVLLASLQRLISSDPHIAMFPTSELEICANDEALPPTLREQAASVIQARAAIAMIKGDAA